MQKMNRLSNSFGIGIIKLNIEDSNSSKILFNAKRREMIDGDTVNHLFEINKDFKEFLLDVENGVKINRVVRYNLDEVKTMSELQDVIVSGEEASPPEETVDNNSTFTEHVEEMDWSSDVTGKKPKRIVIDDEEYEASSWKLVYISFCQFLCKANLEQFKKTKLKGKKRAYFSSIDKDLRVAYYLEEADLYLEVNLSAQSILKNIRALMEEFNIDQQRVKIILEKS